MVVEISPETFFVYIVPAILFIIATIVFIFIKRKSFSYQSDKDFCYFATFVSFGITMAMYVALYLSNFKYYTFDKQTRELILNLKNNQKNHAKVIDKFLELYPNYHYTNNEAQWIFISDSQALQKMEERNLDIMENKSFKYEKVPD